MVQARYDAAAVEPLARTTFLNRIHPEILEALNLQPHMDTIPMVNLANRIWKAKKMGKQFNVQFEPKALIPHHQEQYTVPAPKQQECKWETCYTTKPIETRLDKLTK